RESVRRLLRGGTHWSWWAGVIGIGLVAPTLIVSLAAVDVLGTSIAATYVVMAACLAVLAGGYLLRYCVLKVGVYVTLLER
ncbi:MAG: polysulfide reductase NrfD, partial [Proteobacteria bacterium]|nr:polysulfide reductase NrfD [Pseudomonadota bacterium]